MQKMSKPPKIAFGARFIKKRICLEKPGFSKKYVFFLHTFGCLGTCMCLSEHCVSVYPQI